MEIEFDNTNEGKQVTIIARNMREAVTLAASAAENGLKVQTFDTEVRVTIPVRGTPGRKPGNGNGQIHNVPTKRKTTMTQARLAALAKARRKWQRMSKENRR